MTIRYLLTDPAGVEHVAGDEHEYDALIDRLAEKFPGGEIRVEAVIGERTESKSAS